MNKFFIREIAKPVLRRLGTAAGVALAATTLSAEDIQAVESAIFILGGLAVDLFFSWKDRDSA